MKYDTSIKILVNTTRLALNREKTKDGSIAFFTKYYNIMPSTNMSWDPVEIILKNIKLLMQQH
jgi:hypothetical protein